MAVASLMQTLFNLQTSPPNENSSVHIDSLKDWYGLERELEPEASVEKEMFKSLPNIVSTFDLVHLIGWKYSPDQAKAKQRGTAQFSLRDVVSEMNEEADGDEEKHIKYGVLIDDGEKVIEQYDEEHKK